MSLRDELEPARSNGGVCSVKTFVESQTDPEEWVELVDDKSIQHARLHRLMRKHGFEQTSNAVSRHRNGQCVCGRA